MSGDFQRGDPVWLLHCLDDARCLTPARPATVVCMVGPYVVVAPDHSPHARIGYKARYVVRRSDGEVQPDPVRA